MSFRLGFETGMDTLHILLLLSYCLWLWCNMLWKYQFQGMEIGRPRYVCFYFTVLWFLWFILAWLFLCFFVFIGCLMCFLALVLFVIYFPVKPRFLVRFMVEPKISGQLSWVQTNLGQKVYTLFDLLFFRVLRVFLTNTP